MKNNLNISHEEKYLIKGCSDNGMYPYVNDVPTIVEAVNKAKTYPNIYKDTKKKDETRSSTPVELEYAFKKAASRTPGFLGRAYEKFSNLAYKTNTADWPDYEYAQIYIDDKEISRLFKEDIESKISDIKRVLPYCQGGKFDKLPDPAQEAIIDMAFNLGASGLNDSFVKFNNAMNAGDYRTAANESERNVQADRNKYVKELLLKAAAEMDKLKKAAGAP